MMKHRLLACGIAFAAALTLLAGGRAFRLGAAMQDRPPPAVAADGTVHVPAHDVPFSPFASEAARQSLFATMAKQQGGTNRESYQRASGLSGGAPDMAVIGNLREAYDRENAENARRAGEIYPGVSLRDEMIDGIHAVTVTPGGIPRHNAGRVLIELHGGAFTLGSARTAGLAEAIPLASEAGMKVIALDYRLSPENRFPAASEDVEKVYRRLLKTYRARNIGIYGCSAGGVLAGEVIPWFQKRKLPSPGAIALIGAGGGFIGDGDSGFFALALAGRPLPKPGPDGRWDVKMSYFKGIDPMQPEVSPAYFPAVLAKFPPSLFITGTRDFALSSVAFMHSRLVKAGAISDLHVWEGVQHCFNLDSRLPESREAYKVAATFFDRHLGVR